MLPSACSFLVAEERDKSVRIFKTRSSFGVQQLQDGGPMNETRELALKALRTLNFRAFQSHAER
jgi:hypothetical protein